MNKGTQTHTKEGEGKGLGLRWAPKILCILFSITSYKLTTSEQSHIQTQPSLQPLCYLSIFCILGLSYFVRKLRNFMNLCVFSQNSLMFLNINI